MDWPQFTQEVLAELAPTRMLEERMRPSSVGFDAGGFARSWSEFGAIHVIAAGKPAAAQAEALMALLRGYPAASSRLTRALAITREGYGESSADVEVFYSSHPLPDERALEAGDRVVSRLTQIGRDDLAIFLVSGGASSLVERLVTPYTLKDLRELNERMLRSGASISEINAARTRLSALKGGGWVENCRARCILNLVSCDVPSGDPAIVGSGPGFRDPAVTRVLCDGRDLLQAASRRLAARGIVSLAPAPLLDCPIEEAVEGQIKALEASLARPAEGAFALLSGGEAPVAVKGDGRGGRNSEFVLRMAEALWVRRAVDLGKRRVTVAAIASDGTDGPTDAAGGWLAESDLSGREARLRECLESNDSLAFLEESKTALITGPSAVNLMDLRILTISR